MATYAIGDLQGCFASLQRLISLIQFNPRQDRLWFVGDLVNRGPASLEILRFVKSLGSAAVTVLGNHDLFLIAVAAGLSQLRRKDTLAPVLNAPDRDDLMSWLRRQPLMHREGEYVMVHAGLLPQWTVDEAAGLAREATAGLQRSDWQAILLALHPSGHLQWTPCLMGSTRLATITKVLTRLRACSVDGHMESEFSGPPELTPEGFYPWFRIPTRRSTDATVVCGHWAASGLRIEPGLLALDSGCVYGRRLTAVRLEDRRIFQVTNAEMPVNE